MIRVIFLSLANRRPRNQQQQTEESAAAAADQEVSGNSSRSGNERKPEKRWSDTSSTGAGPESAVAWASDALPAAEAAEAEAMERRRADHLLCIVPHVSSSFSRTKTFHLRLRTNGDPWWALCKQSPSP